MEADRAVVAMWKCLITLCVCVGSGAVAMVWRLTVLLLLCGSVLLHCVFVLVGVRLLWCGG